MGIGYQKANVIYDKADGVEAVVADIKFHGVERTRRDALAKEVGEVYNVSTLGELIRKAGLAATHMQEVGLFTSCVPLIDEAPAGTPGYVVSFVTKEHSAVSLSAKVGMTTYGEADVSFNGAKNNLNGRGEVLDASYTRTLSDNNGFSFSFLKPKLGWQEYSRVSVNAFRAFENLRWSQAELIQTGAVLRYSAQYYSRKIRTSVALNSLWRDFIATKQTPFAVREYAGYTSKFSLEYNVSFDTRDRPLLPTKGIYASLANEFAGLIGDASFTRHQLDLQFAAPFVAKTVLSFGLLANAIQTASGKSLHLADRAYLGGAHDVRGFALRSIGPRAHPSSSATLGGAATFAVAAHIYRPLVPADMLFAHAFLTAGAVCPVRSKSWFADITGSPRVSAGLGIVFVFRDMLRFELNYVLPFRYSSGDSVAPGFQFGAGITFL